MRLERLGFLAGLLLVGLALRPQVAAVGPLIPELKHDLDVPHAVAGLLGTIPVLCMGLFALPAPAVSRRYGARLVIAACLVLTGVFGIARAVSPGAALVVLLTFGVSLGLGFAQAVIPGAVKERFSRRPALFAGMYTLGIAIGNSGSSVLAVPLADAFGGWRWALAVFGLFTGLLVFAWLWLTRGEPPHSRADVQRVRFPWRSRTVWLIVGVFACTAWVYYGLNSWLPDAYVERGWSEEQAGGLLAVLNIVTLVSTLAVSWSADRWGSRRFYLLLESGLSTVSVLGFVLLPGGAWAWAVVAGLGAGGMFPLLMTLPVDVGRRPAEVAAVAGMMLGAGYALAAAGPLVLGAARDVTGTYTATLWLVALSGAAALAFCSSLSRERLARGVVAEASAP